MCAQEKAPAIVLNKPELDLDTRKLEGTPTRKIRPTGETRSGSRPGWYMGSLESMRNGIVLNNSPGGDVGFIMLDWEWRNRVLWARSSGLSGQTLRQGLVASAELAASPPTVGMIPFNLLPFLGARGTQTGPLATRAHQQCAHARTWPSGQRQCRLRDWGPGAPPCRSRGGRACGAFPRGPLKGGAAVCFYLGKRASAVPTTTPTHGAGSNRSILKCS